MIRAIRLVVPAVAVASIAACSGVAEPPEKTGSTEQELLAFATYREPTTTVTTDAGTDTAKVDTTSKTIAVSGATILENATPSAPCAPQRFDVTVSGRTCWDLAKATPSGTWSVAPIFGDAPAAIRDTRCALTWVAKSPTCAAPDVAALALTCKEVHTLVMRSAACAADPGQCGVSGSITTVPAGSATAAREEWPCEPVKIDGGIPGGYVGGCDSCGIITGGMLYLTNPYSSSSILTNVTTTSGPQQLSVAVPSNTTVAVPVSSTYSSGSLYIWPSP